MCDEQESVLDSAAPAGASGRGARPNAALVNDLYDFGDTLGTGGFAVVRLATNKRTGQQVAMKCMSLPQKKQKQKERDDIFYEIGLLAGRGSLARLFRARPLTTQVHEARTPVFPLCMLLLKQPRPLFFTPGSRVDDRMIVKKTLRVLV